MRRVAIVQSCYLPWRGYFDLIHDVDIFVFYDCVQFTKRDWRSRNYIKTKNGALRLTVPVLQSHRGPINRVKIDTSTNWQENHYKAFVYNYRNRPYFQKFKFLLDEVYTRKKWEFLSDLNQETTKIIARLLKIKTAFLDSSELRLTGTKTDRLIDALCKLKADKYISGPSAMEYLEPEKFVQKNINLVYKQYPSYPLYSQAGDNFEGKVTILDLLFNVGFESPRYIWG